MKTNRELLRESVATVVSDYGKEISDANPESRIAAGDIRAEFKQVRGSSSEVEARKKVDENGLP